MPYEIEATISNRSISVQINTALTIGSIGSVRCSFTFDAEWNGLIKTAIFKGVDGKSFPVLLTDTVCNVPNEVLTAGAFFNLGVMGAQDATLVIVTGWAAAALLPGCYTAIAPPSEDIYLQILNEFSTSTAQVKESAQKAEQYAEEIKTSLPAIHQDAETAKAKAATAEAKAAEATASAEKAKTSEINAKASETASGQNLSDLLAMLGTDVATLVGGKIPMSQIPATATQEIYVVLSESELTGLTAQRGDLAELVETVEGEQTIIKTWQCLGDANEQENWVVWGTSYAVQAGASKLADNATNAGMINNHRLVEMTESEYQTAVKDPNTYYLVG